jgi:Beta-lactamase enzyme family
LPTRAAVVSTVAVMLAVAAVAAWTNRATLGHAAGRLGGPDPAPAPVDSAAASSPSPSDEGPGLSMAGQPAPPLLSPGPVDVQVQGFFAWALLDRNTNTITGSANYTSATSSTESMIKAWISSDYLRQLGNAQPPGDKLALLTRMIRDSDDNAAEIIYDLDGSDAVAQRMIKICGLTETSIFDDWWSRTQVSARDAVRLGACVADGRAAGPKWTGWILNEMRQVRGEGRFGIIDALQPDVASRTSIKNGWTIVGDDWHLNCLAIVDQYVLAVLTRYPSELGVRYGAGVCRDIATQLQPRG